MADRPITIAVASGKGGVGKSTIAALLAHAYAQTGMQVALLDADLYGPSLPTLFNLEGRRHEVDKAQKLIPIRHGNIQLVSFGFILGQLPAIMRGPMIARYTAQLLSDVAWEPHQILIIDLPPGTGDIHLTATQSQHIDSAVIVTTPHALSFSDVGKAILMLNKVKVSIAGLVLNMAYFVCDNCNTTHHIFGAAALETIAIRFGIPALISMPLDAARYAQRIPHLQTNEQIQQLADKVWRAARTAPQTAIKIRNSRHAIEITASDGTPHPLPPYRLRRACRCALCYDEYHTAPTAQIDRVPTDIVAEQIKPIGNYALYIKWSDGHDTGFFPLEYLYRLSRQWQAEEGSARPAPPSPKNGASKQ